MGIRPHSIKTMKFKPGEDQSMISIRLPVEMHRALNELAYSKRISVNKMCIDKLSELLPKQGK